MNAPATSMFDPQAFLDSQTTEAAVKRPPLREGDYSAIINDVKPRAWQGKADPSKSGWAFDIPLTIEVPADQQESLGGQTTIKLTDSVFVDVVEGSPNLDWGPGRNSALRKYREALNMNKPGEKFSPRNMIGQMVKVKIKHELYQDEIQERIGGVTRA